MRAITPQQFDHPLKGVVLLLMLFACSARAELRSDIVYGNAAGVDLLLDAHLPKGQGPFPVCLLVHGGGWTQGDKLNNFRTLLPALVEGGFVCFSINYRLAPDHRYPACLDDVGTAIRWVKAHAAGFHADPGRIALVGESAGGHLVSMAAVSAGKDTRVAAVVPFYAPHDLELQAMNQRRVPVWATALFGLSGLDDSGLKVIRDASPVQHVVQSLPPFLLVHGSADEKVPVEQSRRFQETLRSFGNSCDLLLVNGAGHGLVHWDRVDSTYKEKLIAWLKQVMP